MHADNQFLLLQTDKYCLMRVWGWIPTIGSELPKFSRRYFFSGSVLAMAIRKSNQPFISFLFVDPPDTLTLIRSECIRLGTIPLRQPLYTCGTYRHQLRGHLSQREFDFGRG
jgi:hypothetical protein